MPPQPASQARTAGDERRREILRAAIAVFGESGLAGARIDEVARRVGIRRPTVLYHYPDKSTLYAAALADVVDDIASRVAATRDAPGERVHAIADAWADFVIDRPNAARLLLRQMIDVDPTPVSEISNSVSALLGEIQSVLDQETGGDAGKTLPASEFSLVLASTSLVWVASQPAVAGALGLDTLAPGALQRHRRILHGVARQILAAAEEASDTAETQGGIGNLDKTLEVLPQAAALKTKMDDHHVL